MANEEQLAILKQGGETWNKWRQEHVSILLDLSGTDLSNAALSGAIHDGANLSRSGHPF